jgi:regulator of cell morphogenesis and NO signaling
MSVEPQTIDPTLTISAIVQRYPATLAVFNARGLDACCGGGLTLAEAAARHGIDLRELVAALETAARAGPGEGAAGGCGR